MILPSVLALGAHFIVPVADSVPVLNVEPVCQGIARQGGVSFHDPAIVKEQQNCIESEKEVRGELVKQWPNFSASDKSHCINESKMGGDSSYTELLTCLEMARAVRDLGNDSAEQQPRLTPRRRR